MALHLVKMAAGVASLANLKARQKKYLKRIASGPGAPALRYRTRNMPKRAEEILDGGSIYWVFRGHIRARQAIKAISQKRDREGRSYCELRLGRLIVPTVPRPHRAIQGWRYLEETDAPPDLKSGGKEAAAVAALPEALAEELRELGLL